MGIAPGLSMQSEVDRLLRDREDLIRTGCYTQDDPLI